MYIWARGYKTFSMNMKILLINDKRQELGPVLLAYAEIGFLMIRRLNLISLNKHSMLLTIVSAC